MDISALATTATQVLVPFLPMLTHLGDAVMEQAGKKLGGEAWEKVKSLWEKLQPKIDAKTAAQEAVQDAAQHPQDADAHAALRQQLKKLLAEDESLAREIEPIVTAIQQANRTVIASGERSVAIGGSVSGSTIITGDNQHK